MKVTMGSTHRKIILFFAILLILGTIRFTIGIPGATRASTGVTTKITNFDSAGNQVVRFDVAGNAVDAHDGDLALFAGTYYLYGTSYNCGFQWHGAGQPFCGFKVYSSSDLVHWKDLGFLFDASTSVWQTRCNGNTNGCYRPHVIYNASTNLYVLWINGFDNSSSYHVFTSNSPTGPFNEVAQPTLWHMGGNGDFDTFVDNDGTAYIVYAAFLNGNNPTIERLNASYTSGTGASVVVDGNTYPPHNGSEAPSLFRNGSNYFLVYGPNCGYCGSTPTIYKTATNPLGPWSSTATTINSTSCGGQPSFVAVIPTTTGTTYLYGSDLWDNGNSNEALANYFWTPLSFNGASIQSFSCTNNVTLNLATGSAGSQQSVPDLDADAGVSGFRTFSDIGLADRIQTFVPSRTGLLTRASLTTFQHAFPNAGLTLDLVPVDASDQPNGPVLYTLTIPVSSIGWSPRFVSIYPNVNVTAGVRYGILARSATTAGFYGFVYNDSAPYPGGGEAYKPATAPTWSIETNRTIKFQTTVSNGPAAGYTYCSPENGTCSFNGTMTVAYGGNNLYFYKTATGSIPCNNTTFGDPTPGMPKVCWYSPLLKYEAENLTATTNGPTNSLSNDTNCSGGVCMVFQATAVGNVVTYTVQVPVARTYDMRFGVKKYNNKGIFQFASNGINHGSPQDLYSATATFPELDIGNVTFTTAGTKSFTFTVTGKNASSSGYTIGLDYIMLIPQ